jgi:hypothetical protein
MIYVRNDMPVTKQQADDIDLLRTWTGLLSQYDITVDSIRTRQALMSQQMGDSVTMPAAVYAEMHYKLAALPEARDKVQMLSLMSLFLRRNGEDDSQIQAEMKRWDDVAMAPLRAQVKAAQKTKSGGCATLTLVVFSVLTALGLLHVRL